MIRHFYFITLSFLVGVFVATLLPISLPYIIFTLLLSLVSVLIWYRSTFSKEIKGWLVLGMVIAAFALGAFRVEVANWSFGNFILAPQVGNEVTLTGLIAREPEVREKDTYLYVQTETDLVLVSANKYNEYFYGDVVTVKGKLEKPDSFVTDFGRVFNYPGYLKAKGVEYKISFGQVAVVSTSEGNIILTKLFAVKKSFMSKIESLLPEPAAGLGEGLLLGVKQALGEELEAAFRKTGIIHVVVLSGFNVMLVVVFVMFVLGYFLPRRPQVIFGVVAIILFALLVGLSATVVRASIMASLLLIIQMTGRTYFVVRGLILAGLIMVLLNPFLLAYDVGFQLSFVATLGLILISPHLESFLHKVPQFLGARSFLVATLSTQIAVLPLLLYQIGEFSVVAVIVNILVLPMVPVAMLLTFAAGSLSYISLTVASLLAYPTYFSLSYISEIAWWFAKLPFAAYIVPVFPWFLMPISYGLMGFLLWRFRKPEGESGPSELAEKFLTKISTKETDDLSEWCIEEEIETPTKKVVDKSTTSNETPIFFR